MNKASMRQASACLFKLLLILVFFPFSAQGQSNRRLQPQDLLKIPEVRDVRISPNGRQVAFDVTELVDSNQPTGSRRTDIWLVPTDGSALPKRLTDSPNKTSAPGWSPDGNYLAFLSSATSQDSAGKALQIGIVRVESREVEQLTDVPGGVRAFKWSPDGRMIAFTSKDVATAEELRRKQEGNDVIRVGNDDKFTRLWVVSLSDRNVTLVTRQDFQVNDFEWSPDGNKFAARVSSTPRLDDAFWHGRLVIIERATGKVLRNLSEDVSPWEGTLRWSPDGQTIAFPEFTPKRIASWLKLQPVGGGPGRYLLRDYHGTLRGEQWTSDSKYLVAETEVGTKAELLRIEATSGRISKLANVLGNASETSFSASGDGNTISYLCEKPDAPGDVCSITVGNAPRHLTEFHSMLGDFLLGKAQEITWRNAGDGKTIYGVLITPPDFKPGQLYPTVVLVHGGPIMTWATGWNQWGQLLAAHGYVALLPNPRGSEGQGWQFAEANISDWGGKDFQDVMDGVNSLVEKKIADPNRLGIGGWSFGGFMTAWAVTHTGRFKAAFEGAGITDLVSFDGTADISPTFLKIYFPNASLRSLSTYEAHSPINYLANCKTPVLIFHGLTDDVVPVGQSEEFFNGLKMLGANTELLLYPREWHVFSEPVHQLDVLRHILAWFDTYLK